jgi:hypothetical protein
MFQISSNKLQFAISEFKDGVVRLFLAAGGLEVGVAGFSYGARWHDPALIFAGAVGFLAFTGLVGLTIVNTALVWKAVRS